MVVFLKALFWSSLSRLALGFRLIRGRRSRVQGLSMEFKGGTDHFKLAVDGRLGV